MPADALWAFAMAFNVYLSFFHSYTTAQLHKLEPIYVVGCYGIPFVPAFVFLFVNSAARGKVYGSGMVSILYCNEGLDAKQNHRFGAGLTLNGRFSALLLCMAQYGL